MLRYRIRTIVSAVAVWVGISPLWAHHSASAVFEMSKRISVTGTLTKVDWINPHVVISMQGKGVDGNIQQWMFESNPPSWYRSMGFERADLARAIGQTITVEGMPAKNATAYGYMQKMKLPDGTMLNLFTAPGRYK
jgi:Family of unknown function (DUF6152)